jgi:hypothetical protein
MEEVERKRSGLVRGGVKRSREGEGEERRGESTAFSFLEEPVKEEIKGKKGKGNPLFHIWAILFPTKS